MSDNKEAWPDLSLPWQEGRAAAILTPTRLVAPDVDGGARGLIVGHPYGWNQREARVVEESWRSQCLVVHVDGVIVRIQARLGTDGYGGVRGDQGEPAGDDWPLADDVLVAGSVRGPSPSFSQEQVSSRDELLRRLERAHVRARGAIVVDRDHGWTELAVIGTGDATAERFQPAWQERFLEDCHAEGIDTVVRIRNAQWQVLASRPARGGGVRTLSTDPCSMTRDDDHRCPQLRAPAVGEYCQMYGGPWTSASIHAAMGWMEHRDRLVSAVGCDTCDGRRFVLSGKVHERGGPISLVTLPVPTRWLWPAPRK